MNTPNIPVVPQSAISVVLAMFMEPSRAFAAIKERNMVWLPLILILSATIVTFVWYFQTVDFSWMLDKLFASIPNAADREAAKSFMTKGAMQASTIGGSLISFPIILSLMAAYFLIIAKIKNIDIGFSKWFAFVTWSSLPSILILPLGAMQILLAKHGQLGLDQIQPVSLNQLIFQIEAGKPWASLLDSINISSVWTAILMVIGFQILTKLPRKTALLTVLTPYAVIYGVWILFTVFKHAA